MGALDWFSAWCQSERRLDGLTAIVTGSNTGIGKEIAKEFYFRGATVIMACRSIERAKVAKYDIEKNRSSNCGSLIISKLNLSSLTSVRDFVSGVVDREKKAHVDILVNNAGVMMVPKGVTEDGFETHIGVNLLAHALLTLLLLPLLRRSMSARIVFLSSFVHNDYCVDVDDTNMEGKLYDPYEAYCRSKAAVILFVRELAKKMKEFGINNVKAYSVNPGIVATDLGRHFGDTYFYGATWIWYNVMSIFVKSPRCGAQTAIYCSVSEECTHQSGLYYSDCKAKESSIETRDKETASKLWELIIKFVGLDDLNIFE